jgi:hypothetical protein
LIGEIDYLKLENVNTEITNHKFTCLLLGSARDLLPYDTADGEGFRIYCSDLTPSYKPMDRHTVRTIVSNFAFNLRKELWEDLKKM